MTVPVLCKVYRSERKADTYLYLPISSNIESLPEPLRAQLGDLTEVMLLDLDRRDSLANADIGKVKQALAEAGYFLQLPPGPSEFLNRRESS